MIISRHQVAQVLRAYGLKPPDPADARPAAGGSSRPAERDRVDLSPAAEAVRRWAQLAKALPEERPERVAELRQRLQRGEYRVDAQQVAERMLYRLLVDRAQEERRG